MNDLLRERRTTLLLLGGATLLICTAIWYYVIREAELAIQKVVGQTETVQQKIIATRRQVQLLDRLEAEQIGDEAVLKDYEERMPHGDIYVWISQRLEEQQRAYGVTFDAIHPPVHGEADVFPKVPYKAARFTVAGTATYFGFGEFLANFENSFPHMAIRRLELEPAAGFAQTQRLGFKMEFSMLIRSGTNAPLERAKRSP